jgi:hypothetical protein
MLGAPLGPIVAGLLGDTAAADRLADVLGTAITDLLAYPGMAGALTGFADQIADAVLAGTPVAEALQSALTALQADLAYLGAVAAVLPGAVDAIVGDTAIRSALGTAAAALVSGLLADAGVNIPVLDSLAGEFTRGVLVSLLGDVSVADLISRIGIDVLSGAAVSDVVDIALAAIVWEPGLQIAIGTALGQGIGSLFGDNIFGEMVGWVAGVNATLLVGIVAGIARFFVPAPPAGPAQAVAGAYLVEQVPAPGELFVMAATVAQGAPSQGVGADGPLKLTEIAAPGPGGLAPVFFVDTQLLLDRAGTLLGVKADAPVLVSFRFSLAQLLSGGGLSGRNVVDQGVERIEDELIGVGV